MTVFYDNLEWHSMSNQRPYFKPIGVHEGDAAWHRLLHQYIWEQANGPIPKGMCCHHIDHNPLNNILANLMLMTKGMHSSLHFKNKPSSFKGHKQSPEAIEKMRAKLLGHPTSPETRKKIGESNHRANLDKKLKRSICWSA